MADGEVLYENGEFKTLDIEKVVFEANKATDDILEKLRKGE
jgi:5-methylthioadenosine/S-adenosylhomocysteine deaminase